MTQTVTVRGPVDTGTHRDLLDWLQLIGVFAAVVSAGFIWRQLRSADHATRQQRAAELAAIWTSRDFRAQLSQVRAFVEIGGAKECLEKVREWVRAPNSEELSLALDGPDAIDPRWITRNDILHVFGWIEDVGLRYNQGEVEREWVALTMGQNLIDLFQESLWLVWFVRAYHAWPSANYEWEKTVVDLRAPRRRWVWPHHLRAHYRAWRDDRWKRSDHPILGDLRGDAKPLPVRFICLPPRPGAADANAWATAFRLATALADWDTRAALRKRFAPRGRSSDPGWKVFALPCSLDQLSDGETLAELGASLTTHLHAVSPDELDEALTALDHAGAVPSR